MTIRKSGEVSSDFVALGRSREKYSKKINFDITHTKGSEGTSVSSSYMMVLKSMIICEFWFIRREVTACTTVSYGSALQFGDVKCTCNCCEVWCTGECENLFILHKIFWIFSLLVFFFILFHPQYLPLFASLFLVAIHLNMVQPAAILTFLPLFLIFLTRLFFFALNHVLWALIQPD